MPGVTPLLCISLRLDEYLPLSRQCVILLNNVALLVLRVIAEVLSS